MIIPKNISFNLWARQLNIDYPIDTIPIPPNEDNWKTWAASVVQSDSFTKAGVPSPSNEKHWSEWADKVYQLMG
jgi:hypothetical protein